MKFTDKEIREAYRDAKAHREFAFRHYSPDCARLEHVKMVALTRWIPAPLRRA